MEISLAKEKIIEAIKKFIEKDREDLLKVNVYEPTLSHRIGVYLETLFPGHHIDCEYNKHFDRSKTVLDREIGERKIIRPDIVIHRARGLDTENLVVFEIKKAGRKSKNARNDIRKLENYTNGDLNYKLGVFVGILKKSIDIVWIEKNKENIEIVL